MNTTLKNYIFDKVAGTITFLSAQYLFLGGFSTITHVPSGTVIFDEASTDKLGFIYVWDRDKVLADPAASNALLASYNAGDGVHLSEAGYTADGLALKAVLAPIVAAIV